MTAPTTHLDSPLGVRSPTGRAAGMTASVLASLPVSFAASPADGEVPVDVVIVDGSTGWPERVAEAISARAVGVVVVDPTAADLTALLNQTPTNPTVVLVDSPWAANPVVADAATAIRSAALLGSRLESRIDLPPTRDLRRALLHQLMLVRELLGPVTDLEVLTWSRSGYDAEGAAGSCLVDFTAITSEAVSESATVRLITPDGSVELSIPSPATAQPARLTAVGPAGALLLPTRYESAHRATWRRLRSMVDAGDLASSLAALQHLHDDSATLTSAVPTVV